MLLKSDDNTPQSAFSARGCGLLKFKSCIDVKWKRLYLEQRCCCCLSLENIFRVGWISENLVWYLQIEETLGSRLWQGFLTSVNCINTISLILKLHHSFIYLRSALRKVTYFSRFMNFSSVIKLASMATERNRSSTRRATWDRSRSTRIDSTSSTDITVLPPAYNAPKQARAIIVETAVAVDFICSVRRCRPHSGFAGIPGDTKAKYFLLFFGTVKTTSFFPVRPVHDISFF